MPGIYRKIGFLARHSVERKSKMAVNSSAMILVPILI
jgi:hypothetical protein